MTAPMLLAAMMLDAALGEPRWLWSRLPHPAVLIGRVVDFADRAWNRGHGRRAKGALLIFGLCAAGGVIAWVISNLPFGPLWEVLLTAILLAQRSLADHLRAVALGLRDGIGPGRRAVAMIVGRDTSAMDAPAVARAALESGAENLSDGVIAPAFWFLILGLPGILIYKIVNTADSMIGHRTERHEAFGWAAARLDDLLNWVPARLTAALLALAFADPGAWQAACRDGPRHRSPNAGWPEAALARGLSVALAGPRSYGGVTEPHPFVNPTGRRDPGAADIEAGIAALWRAWAIFGICVAVWAVVT